MICQFVNLPICQFANLSICQFVDLRNLQGFVVFVVNLITKVLRSSYTQSILNVYLIYTQDMIAVFLIKRGNN